MEALKTMKTASRTWKSGRDADGGDNLDNAGQLLQGAPPERAADGKRMGKRVGAGSAGVPPAGKLENDKRPKVHCFPQSPIQRSRGKPPPRMSRDGCSEGYAPLPGVRHPAAPKRMESGSTDNGPTPPTLATPRHSGLFPVFLSGGSRARGLSGKWWRQGRAWRFGGWREGPYRQGRDCRDSCGRWA